MKTIRKQDAELYKATNADIVNHVLKKSSCISKRRTTRTRKIDFYYF